METQAELSQRVLREQKLMVRLHLATTRLEDAQQERIWAIAFQWTDRQNLVRVISSGLDEFDAWDAEGVQELLQTLAETENVGTEHSLFGKVLSRWVQAVNLGDDLLWKYITRNVDSEDVFRRDISNQLHCKPHEFHQENFLVERFKQSDEMLTLVLSSLKRWSNDKAGEYREDTLRTGFLWDTSWRLKHNKHEIYHADDLTILLDSLENALNHRARQDDEWWRTNEPYLRTTQDAALRYLVIQAYKENIQTNLPGIECQLQDEELSLFCHFPS